MPRGQNTLDEVNRRSMSPPPPTEEEMPPIESMSKPPPPTEEEMPALEDMPNEEGEEEEVEEEPEEEEEPQGKPPVSPQPPVVSEGISPKSSRTSGSFSGPPLVTSLLFLLIIANAFSSGQISAIGGAITQQKGSTITASRNAFIAIGGELVFLIFISIVAESSDTANKMAMVFVVVLWLVWGFHNRSLIANFASKINPQKQGG